MVLQEIGPQYSARPLNRADLERLFATRAIKILAFVLLSRLKPQPQVFLKDCSSPLV
jgi:hypothetical protein